MKCYDILNKGQRPFCAEVGEVISVWKQHYVQDHDDQGHWELGKLLLFQTVKQIWIGDNYSPHDQRTPAYAPRFRHPGNTILFRHEITNAYVFVGPIIYSFVPVDGDEIRDFYSPVRISDDEPVPYAFGLKYVYFLSDLTYLPRDAFRGPEDHQDALPLPVVEVIEPCA
jgi:hypothetical protein